MRSTRKTASIWIGLYLMSFILVGCSKPAYIRVLYRPPEPSYLLEGRQAVLQVRDERSDQQIFGEKAQQQFEHFTGLFALSIAVFDENEPGIVGAFELQEMLAQALRRRLERAGLTVPGSDAKAAPVLEIGLQRFFIELAGRTWKTDIGYEARLIQDGRVLARQTVSGTVEKFKIIGIGEAEKAVSEIFTDMVNKFNIHDLFLQGGLL